MSRLNERMKALAQALGAIEKQFGKGAVMRLGEASEPAPVQVVPTGSLGLDLALGTVEEGPVTFQVEAFARQCGDGVLDQRPADQ